MSKEKVGILTPKGLSDRWNKPFLKEGMEVVHIPINAQDVERVVEILDALLLPGGRSNIHPSSCGLDGATLEGEFYDIDRDRFSAKLIKQAYQLDLPTLGICRGMQEMVAVFGGAF